MAQTQNTNVNRFGGVLRDIGSAIGDMFGGGKLDADQVASIEVEFGLLGYIAGADSIITTGEAHVVNQIMDEMHLSTRARDLAHEAFTRGRKREINVARELRRHLSLHAAESAETEHLFDGLFRVASADGRIRPREKAALEQITTELGLPLSLLKARLTA
ncbi:TerB family tellurite resistance protein [Tahibacter amnicola]|uniref:TerB family tellurite resistance protein n=1 Tax=Tahibacter amnicola TaxID=2976241 RepID=A0ABY6B9G7_9GAMM|nr:TerB family tellurite resistance protein [Tahibacter amnicola]UXI66713.1 TerB family tellurite resistance protein [Tahibacter amnicola]